MKRKRYSVEQIVTAKHQLEQWRHYVIMTCHARAHKLSDTDAIFPQLGIS
jgi:hypothetical protein